MPAVMQRNALLRQTRTGQRGALQMLADTPRSAQQSRMTSGRTRWRLPAAAWLWTPSE